MGHIIKIIVLACLVSPIIYAACKQKKWYLYVFCAFYTILPDTFAIEISSSFPLITFKRIMIIFICVLWIYNYKFIRRICIPKELFMFIAVNVIVSAVNLRFGFGELNNIFIVVFEQFLLIMALKGLIVDKEELYRCIDFLIYGSTVLAVISILQTTVGYDLSTAFATVDARVIETISNSELEHKTEHLKEVMKYNMLSNDELEKIASKNLLE